MTFEFFETAPGVFKLVRGKKIKGKWQHTFGPETISKIRTDQWVALDETTEAPATFKRSGEAAAYLIAACRLQPRGGDVNWRFVSADANIVAWGGGHQTPL